MEDLVAEPLLAPHQQRAVDAPAVPARLTVGARHQALGAGPAVLIERPALRKAAETEADEALVPFRRRRRRIERDHPVEARRSPASKRSRSTRISPRTISASGSSGISASARSQLASASSARPSLRRMTARVTSAARCAGRERERAVDRRQRIGMPAELVERIGAVVVGVGIARFEGDRALQACERLLMAAERSQRVAVIVVRRREVRRERKRRGRSSRPPAHGGRDRAGRRRDCTSR